MSDEEGSDNFQTILLENVIVDVQHFDSSNIFVMIYGKTVLVTGYHQEQSDDHGFVMRSFRRTYELVGDEGYKSFSVIINPARLMLIRASNVKVFETEKDRIRYYMDKFISPDNVDLLGDSLIRGAVEELHAKVISRLKTALKSYTETFSAEMNQVGTDKIDGSNVSLNVPSVSRNTISSDSGSVGVSIALSRLEEHRAALLRESASQSFPIPMDRIERLIKRKSLKRSFVSEDSFQGPSTSQLCEEPLLRDRGTFPGPSTSKQYEEPVLRDQSTYPAESSGKSPEKRKKDQSTYPAESSGKSPEKRKKDQSTFPAESSGKSPEKRKKGQSTFPAESSSKSPEKRRKDKGTIPEWELTAQRRDRKRSTDQPPPPEVAEHKKPKEQEEEESSV